MPSLPSGIQLVVYRIPHHILISTVSLYFVRILKSSILFVFIVTDYLGSIFHRFILAAFLNKQKNDGFSKQRSVAVYYLVILKSFKSNDGDF